MKPTFECSCERCQKACMTRPGLFMPGEAEKLAAYAGWSIAEMFEAGVLAVERVPCHPHEIMVLRPADVDGACVFFQGGRCEIHAMEKPHECAMATHDGGAALADIVDAWAPYQDALRELAA